MIEVGFNYLMMMMAWRRGVLSVLRRTKASYKATHIFPFILSQTNRALLCCVAINKGSLVFFLSLKRREGKGGFEI